MTEKPKLEIISEEVLDEEEAEFRKLRRDLPGVKGASANGIVAISVGNIPGKNPIYPRDRGGQAAIEIMEILQDSYPDIAQSERVYGLTMCRLARFLRDRDNELETDVIRQFSD